MQSLTTSLQFFKDGWPSQCKQQIFQHHLQQISLLFTNKKYLSLLPNMLSILIERYYELILKNANKTVFNQLQQYLFNKFLLTIQACIETTKSLNVSKDEAIVLLWSTLTHLKQLKISTLYPVLFRITTTLLQFVPIFQVYPQAYSAYAQTLHQGASFQLCLFSMRILIQKVIAVFKKASSAFLKEFYLRLTTFFTNILNKIQNIQLNSKAANSCRQFIQSIQNITIVIQQPILNLQHLTDRDQQKESFQIIRRECLFAYVMLQLQLGMKLNLDKYQYKEKEQICVYFVEQMTKKISRLILTTDIDEKKKNLHTVSIMLKNEFSTSQINIIPLLDAFTHISIHHKLLSLPPQNCSFTPLLPTHTSKTYPFGLQSMLKFQMHRIHLQTLSYTHLQSQILNAIQQLIHNLPFQIVYNALEHYTQILLQYQYGIYAQINSIYRHLSTIIAIQWLVKRCQRDKILNCAEELRPSLQIIFSQLCWKSQATSKLLPKFQEQQLLVSTTLICIYNCFILLKRCTTKTPSFIMQDLKKKHALCERLLSCVSQKSYILQMTSYYILFQLIKQQGQNTSICQYLSSVQSTLLHRNRNNISMMSSLLRLSAFSQIQYEQLAHYYMRHPSEQILQFLLQKVPSETARKCILAVPRFPLLLSQSNVKYLHKKPLKTTVEPKGTMFEVVDSQNVVINNALGVIVLQLGDKWEEALKSKWKEITLDSIQALLKVNPDLIFFRSRFKSILPCLLNILLEVINDPFYNRLCDKIFSILGNISSLNYKIMQGKELHSLRKYCEDYINNIKNQNKISMLQRIQNINKFLQHTKINLQDMD